MNTLKQLREFILELEQKYQLLELEVSGVKPWLLHRVQIDYDLAKVLGFLDAPDGEIERPPIGRMLANCLFRNPYLSSKRDVLVFSHERVSEIDHQNIDVYTHYLVEKLRDDGTNLLEIEQPAKGPYLKRREPWRRSIDLVLALKRLLSPLVSIDRDVEKDALTTIRKVALEINEKIGPYPLEEILIGEVKKFRVAYWLYRQLLKRLDPKQIYLVVSYCRFGALIKAANDIGIPTIEIQHGGFTEYHFGYFFGDEKGPLDYFPDKLQVWSEYWKDLIAFPIPSEDVEVTGFLHLESRKKHLGYIEKVAGRLVVLSQTALGRSIAEKIRDNWDYFGQFEILYKLHPNEYQQWRDYPALAEIASHENVSMIEDRDLYEILASCEYQAGVFSTALHEGVEFGCKTILLNLPGVEEMDRFAEKYSVTRV